jgi:hypothetical protein
MKVTYHDPCDLGRASGIYEAPRDILKAIPGVELVEIEDWNCCALRSNDGGLTWQETHECGLNECSFKHLNTFTAYDGTKWQFEELKGADQIQVSRRMQTEDGWTVTSKIPAHWNYSNGKVITP